MNITWTVLAMRGVDAGAPLGTVVTEVSVQIKAEKDGASAVEKRALRICKPKVREDGVSWYAPAINPDNFLQYDTVTEQDVITWVKNALGTTEVATIESMLEHSVERILNAPVIPKPVMLVPPWE
jgi:hypothetical protein